MEGSYVSKITDPSTATERQRISDETNRQKWNKNAMKAADFMTPRITQEVKRLLDDEHFNNGHLMMHRIHQLLQPTSDAQFMRLIKEFYSIKPIDVGGTMTDYLAHIKKLDEQIMATQIELTREKRIIIAIMMGLPEEYQGLVQIWNCMTNLTVEQARIMILEEERRQLNKDGPKAMSLKTSVDEDKKCPICKRKWHPLDDCWKLHPEKAPDWFKEQKSKNKDKDKDKSKDDDGTSAKYAYSFGS